MQQFQTVSNDKISKANTDGMGSHHDRKRALPKIKGGGGHGSDSGRIHGKNDGNM